MSTKRTKRNRKITIRDYRVADKMIRQMLDHETGERKRREAEKARAVVADFDLSSYTSH